MDANDKNNKECLRMQINDSKAGMQNIDKEKINSIILKHSQNSKYYKKQQLRDNEIRKKAEEKLKSLINYSSFEIESARKTADEYLAKIEKRRDFTRVLVHIDMDAFYANVEIKDNPELATKPMAVGSDSMLSTSNYIARRYGVRAAMPGFIAKELCPELIIIPCHFDRYRSESKLIMQIISEYDSNYSAASLDEAYLDLTEHLRQRANYEISKRTFPLDTDSNESIVFGISDEECVKEIRHRIYLKTKLTASAGIASNLRLAKMCSDVNKPNGQFKLENNADTIVSFIADLPIRKINGIGPSSSLLLDCYGVKTCKDLYVKRDILYLLETQNSFEFLMTVCRGLGNNTIEHDGVQKSIGHETTFSTKNANNIDEHLKTCLELSKEVAEELKNDKLMAQKVNLKIKTTDFNVFTRTRSMNCYTDDATKINEAAKYLLLHEWESSQKKLKLRLIGVRVSDLRDSSIQDVKTSHSATVQSKKIENFFKKIDKNELKKSINNNDSLEEDDTLSLKENICTFCVYCQSYIEGNRDFIEQHKDSCLL